MLAEVEVSPKAAGHVSSCILCLAYYGLPLSP